MALNFGQGASGLFLSSDQSNEGFGGKGELNLNRASVQKNALQTLGNGATVNVIWNVVDFDDDKMFNAADNTKLTIQSDGDYLIEVGMSFENNGNGNRQLGVHINNGSASIQDNLTPNAGQNGILGCSRILRLSAGDYIQVRGLQSSGGNLDLSANGANFLQVMKIGTVIQ